MRRQSGICKFLLFVVFAAVAFSEGAFKEKIKTVLIKTEESLKTIFERWQIDKFPNFLRSVAMTHTSWEVLKLKFQQKILSAAAGNKETFVISFMGSSVTAGHDSPFNVSFPILTGVNLRPALEAAGITVDSRNTAMGNNPCMPYDVCVKAFSGADVDIVHWEQSFNCGGDDMNKRVEFEQFIRQSLTLPNQPIVIFSESSTPNWPETDCKNPPSPKITDDEKKMLSLTNTEPVKIVSEMNNNDDSAAPWRAMLEMFKKYKMAGIQMWKHTAYEAYKCNGPYVKNWACCSASWHPSLLGHELRAAHYAYFWLLALKDALKDLAHVADVDLPAKLAFVKKRTDSEHKYIPGQQMTPSEFSDNMQCFTTFEPLQDQDSNFFSLVIPSGDSKPPFVAKIFEELTNPEIVKMARGRGYRDFKRMLYGNKDSSPLSLKITINNAGIGWLCTPPGNWGKLPNGFKNFWEANTKVFLTANVGEATGFVFDSGKAKEMAYVNKKPKDTQNVCVYFTEKFRPGSHVLTIVPADSANIMFSYLLLP